MLKIHCILSMLIHIYIYMCIYIFLTYKKEIKFYRSFPSNDYKISLSLWKNGRDSVRDLLHLIYTWVTVPLNTVLNRISDIFDSRCLYQASSG